MLSATSYSLLHYRPLKLPQLNRTSIPELEKVPVNFLKGNNNFRSVK